MQPHIWLRVSAVLTLLYCAGHTSGIPWTPGETPAAANVVTAMQTTRFGAQGVDRSYWDYYFGFGVIISVFLLILAVALWQLGSVTRSTPVAARPMMISFFLCFAINAVLSWQYFFALPAIFALAICLMIAIAFVRTL